MTDLELIEEEPDYTEDLDEDEESFIEADDEARRGRVRLRNLGRYRRSGGVRSATWQNPNGQQQRIQFPKNLVTTDQLNQALAKVASDVKKVSASVVAVDKRTGHIDRRLKSSQQMSVLLPLLAGKPQLESFTRTETVSGTPTETTYNVKPDSTKYKSSSTEMLLPLMLLMGGGDGLGGNNSMLPLLLIMTLNK